MAPGIAALLVVAAVVGAGFARGLSYKAVVLTGCYVCSGFPCRETDFSQLFVVSLL
jgi:hypothetical protein